MKFKVILLALVILYACKHNTDNDTIENPSENQNTALYFPPVNNDNWETISTEALGWNTTAINDLQAYLEQKNTKAFIVLKNGKIALELYFDDFTKNSNWYWASAGKTLTATLTGIAQDEGYLSVSDKVSDYLGTGWTSAPIAKENLITNKHLLSMTSGLDDTQGDAVSSENLTYIADAGTRWAYHNVYVKIQDVVANATNNSWNSYFNSKLRNPIGMNGVWTDLDGLQVYWSTARSMARFGLLISANGKWENTQIVSEAFLNEARNTSQNINLAYGYLWWLNGKNSYHLPQSQFQFSGSLIPNAPDDMYAGLGKNDQKVYIIPSKQLVIVRMGESADGTNFGLSDFDNVLWGKINTMIN